jgi:hypothetical protein
MMRAPNSEANFMYRVSIENRRYRICTFFPFLDRVSFRPAVKRELSSRQMKSITSCGSIFRRRMLGRPPFLIVRGSTPEIWRRWCFNPRWSLQIYKYEYTQTKRLWNVYNDTYQRIFLYATNCFYLL